MRIIFYLGFLIFPSFFCILSSCGVWDTTTLSNYYLSPQILDKINQTKAIFFEYIVADNDLSECADADISEILLSTQKNSDIVYFIFVDKSGYGDSNLYLAYGGNLYLIKNYGELDSGNYRTLENVVLDIKSFLDNNGIIYNDKNFYLIIWDHGDAWIYHPKSKMIALDRTSNDCMNINELVDALKFINAKFHEIDLLGFDACLMGNIETLYSIFINNITNYVIASEYYEPGNGWNYNVVFENVSNLYLVGKNFIDTYAYYYEDVSPDSYSLALYEVNNTLSYISYINKTATKLIQLENTSFEVVKTYAVKFRISSYLIDSYILLNNSAKDLGFTFNYTAFPLYLKTNLSNIKGATISFPTTLDDIRDFSLYYVNSTINPFINTNYGKFVKDFLNYNL